MRPSSQRSASSSRPASSAARARSAAARAITSCGASDKGVERGERARQLARPPQELRALDRHFRRFFGFEQEQRAAQLAAQAQHPHQLDQQRRGRYPRAHQILGQVDDRIGHRRLAQRQGQPERVADRRPSFGTRSRLEIQKAQ
jgi:hypothetical protein